MKAIIPVAGVGSRLRPHTFSQPKVLLNVAGKPIIDHIMDKLIDSGIDEVVVIVGHLGDKIERHLESRYSIKMTFVAQTRQLGLAHAVHMCRPYISDDEPVFIILGDTIFDVDLMPVLESDRSSLGVREVEDPRRFGVAVTENGRITRLVEKPEQPVSNLALVGLYFLQNAGLLFSSIEHIIENNITTKGEFQLTDALQHMIDLGEPFSTFPVQGWYDCGKPDTLLETNEVLLHKYHQEKPRKGCIINPPVFIADSATVSNAIIGPNVTIAEHAVVYDAIIMNAIIGEKSQVNNIMLDRSIVGSHTVVSSMGHQLNIGDYSEIRMG
ncbi:MAG: NTP transferase domain-containing protein [Chlorobiaceae bacterium]|nr:NTP transferase domain-containing protein [Chlorobiaceae bacterium]